MVASMGGRRGMDSVRFYRNMGLREVKENRYRCAALVALPRLAVLAVAVPQLGVDAPGQQQSQSPLRGSG